MAGPAVFIGYRRDDVPDVAGRVYDRLVSELGRPAVFKDVDAIPLGVDYHDHIRRELGRCRMFLALIGPGWVQARLHDPSDWVRVELEFALATEGMLVIPVLVNGARMPTAGELPEALHPLLRRNAARLERDPDFHAGMDRILRAYRDAEPAPGDLRTIDCGGAPLELVWTPPGRFRMGATAAGDALAFGDEGPEREVQITRGFWFGRHPVTVRQYQAFCSATGRPAPEAMKRPNTRAEDLPVTGVDWRDAGAFAAWLEGALPTEAEWEWAARGTDGRRYPWGAAPPDPSRAWWVAASGAPDGKWRGDLGAADQKRAPAGPAPVGGRPAGRGPFGAEDLAGNVWEWCRDAWGDRHLADAVDPCRDDGSRRVARGGSWCNPSRELRSTRRFGFAPGARFDDVGFRVLVRSTR